MRAFLIAAAALLCAGCAGQPGEKPASAPASVPVAAAPTAAPVATAASAAATAAPTDVAAAPAAPATVAAPAGKASTEYVAANGPEAKTLEEAMKMGYKVVNEKGQTMYCRETQAIGSHLKKDRTCLTPQELEAAREANHRNFENMKKYTPPPQGK